MANEAQAKLWDDVVGDAWVANAASYDEMLHPVGEAVMAQLDLQPGCRVLDIGCGTGSTTVAIAQRVAPGNVVGCDLSARMLGAAAERAERAAVHNVAFRHGDIQTADLGTAAFDIGFSRMGVMFFADPVAAFGNIATALTADGRLAFSCFQDVSRNIELVSPVMAVAEILDLPLVSDPQEPGPFSLADPDHLTSILTEAGFVDVVIAPGPGDVTLRGADDLEGLAMRRLMQNPLANPRFMLADAATKQQAIAAAAASLAPHRHGDVLKLRLATWIVTAHTAGGHAVS